MTTFISMNNRSWIVSYNVWLYSIVLNYLLINLRFSSLSHGWPKPILGVLFISFGVLALEDIQNYLAFQSFDGGRRGCDCSWIYNYLCNQCLSPLMLWVWISIRARFKTLCDKVCQWLATGRWFLPGPPVSSTNKTEIMLKMALSTIKQTNKQTSI